MKLISLNIWGGHELAPLLTFIKDQSKDTDIFCFQEVFDCKKEIITDEGYKSNILDDLKKILPEYNCNFSLTLQNYAFNKNVDYDLNLGLVSFAKKYIDVKACKDFFVFQKLNEVNKNAKGEFLLPENIQYIKFSKNSFNYTIAFFHGIVLPGNKKDTKNRIMQSIKIKEFLSKQNGKIVLTGDYNLLPSTNSLKILEEGMLNLNKKYNIKKTRSKLNTQGKQRFADYTLVSKDIKVHNFNVPENILVSDHLPMILEFD